MLGSAGSIVVVVRVAPPRKQRPFTVALLATLEVDCSLCFLVGVVDNRLGGLCSTKCYSTRPVRLDSTRTGEARGKQHLQGDAARGPAPHKAGIGGLSFALFALAGPLNVDTEDAG